MICRPDGVELMSGVVDAGCGTNSPYRSEAYGVLAGMRYAFESGLEDDFDHVLDNEAVVKVYQNCEERGPLLVCSQDVWDEIIWYKRHFCGRYRVRWRRGHAEDRGELRAVEDRANHLADGLAKAGYMAAVDCRRHFEHARRWHVRMDGVRPFDDVRSSARLHVGLRRLREYRAGHSDGRDLDVDMLRAFCGGAPSKSVWGRSENARFVHRQLATARRLRRWGMGQHLDSERCRACGREIETVRHLLVGCSATGCWDARRNFIRDLREHAVETSADIGDFLRRRLTMTSTGELRCDGNATDAFGLVTGFLPAGLRAAIRTTARRGSDEDARTFVHWLRGHCKRVLWRPVWETAKEAGGIDDEEDELDQEDELPGEGDADDDDDIHDRL